MSSKVALLPSIWPMASLVNSMSNDNALFTNHKMSGSKHEHTGIILTISNKNVFFAILTPAGQRILDIFYDGLINTKHKSGGIVSLTLGLSYALH